VILPTARSDAIEWRSIITNCIQQKGGTRIAQILAGALK
jgi:hypothetical protein